MTKLRRFFRRWWLDQLAALLAAAEVYVTLGFKLPYSDDIPQEIRGLVIIAIIVAARILALIQSRREAGRG